MKQQLAVVVGNAHTGRRTQNKKRQKRMQHDDPKKALLASLGGSVVCRKRKEAQKKRKNKKDKKAKKRLPKKQGSTGHSGGRFEHQREGTTKIGGFKKGEKRTSFGPRRVLKCVGEKV